jgi:hypothetical protein
VIRGVARPGRQRRKLAVRQDWEPEDLLASWTLIEADWELVANKADATRLGFALLLKFFELEARFPRDRGELPIAAVAFVAEQSASLPASPGRTSSLTTQAARKRAVRGSTRFCLCFAMATR